MRRIIAYKHYFQEFMEKLTEEQRKKVKRALLLFETEDKYHITISSLLETVFMNLE